MAARIRMLWASVRDSLWFLPGTLTFACAALALVMVHLEKEGVVSLGSAGHLLLGGGAEGARGVLSAIAGGLITVTGVVFSVTIVALQLASSQFTPRVLRNFTADRANQLVLGVFIGTFTYTLLVLRVVRSETAEGGAFIPRLSVAIAVVLVLVSIGFLIYFIDHASRSIQVSVILDRVTRQTLAQAERLFPETVGDPDPEPTPLPQGPSGLVAAAEAGYLQAVDEGALFALGRTERLRIVMAPRIGEHLLPGRPLACVWPAGAVDERVERAVRRAFVVGPDRTPEQDVEFGIIEIADIAVKALSPGINDPTTATRCIDCLAEILLRLAERHPPRPVRTREGVVHFVARRSPFDRLVGLAFDQIRHFGADNPAIMKKLADTLGQLLELVAADRREPLRAQRAAVSADAARALRSPAALDDVERLAARAGGR